MESTPKATTILKKLPYDIIAFFLFAIAVSAFSFYLDLDVNKELKATLIPYTGWGFGNGYLFLVLFIPLAILSFKTTLTKTLRILRIMIILPMLLNAYHGFRDWLEVVPEDYTNPNPYLRYDELTPIYTVATPVFWILLMATTLTWQALKSKKEKVPNPETPS